MIPAARRRELLELARQSLETAFAGEPLPRLASDRAPEFGRSQGVFVTLRKAGELRGCIGTVASDGDLSGIVPLFARKAAFEDPRFPNLRAEELVVCDIEISVLSEPRAIAGPEEIEIGKDGLILEGHGRRGLLLPQVAPEWGFAAERFLEETARKAGLPAGAWRDPEVRIFAFGAEVFSESELAAGGE
ncbi:MAG TPA: AmmeMemoRadiSam system protein A [Thermoanaerobaculia bacterium]|jgi:AmmeMemoRadiSam system protein A